MNIRPKLILPIGAMLLLSFTLFITYLVVDQTRMQDKTLKAKIENISELIAMTNVANVWNIDKPAIGENIKAFLKDEEVVGIRILGSNGEVISEISEPSLGKPIVKVADIVREGETIGKAEVSLSDTHLRARIGALASQVIVMGVLVLAAMILILLYTANMISRPVLNLVKAVSDISEGEGDLSRRIESKSTDETGVLSGHFDAFVGKLRAIIESLKESGRKGRDIGAELASNATEVAATAEEIASTMRSMNERTGYLYDEIEKTNSSVEKINGYIEKVVSAIAEQAAAVHESSASVQQMIANLGSIERATESKRELIINLSSLAKKGEEGMEKNVQAIDDISKSTQFIFDLISVINQIAGQTNLLAMNASIEAAHAGDAGRGFSVVADEIRKLAEKTALNAKDISASLKDIIAKIGGSAEISSSANDVIRRVWAGINEVADSMTETLNGLKEISLGSTQIIESITQLNKLTEEVHSSGMGMKAGTGDVEASVKSIYAISTENKNGMGEITSGIGGISKAIQRLAELSVGNAATIDGLEKELSRFKT
jgi:methyl-accepting chemotaxis protein